MRQIMNWRTRLALATAMTLWGFSLGRISAQTAAASPIPSEVVLQNSSMLLRFRADGKGLRLANLENLLTRKEYLHSTYDPADAGSPSPSVWRGSASEEALAKGSGSVDASVVGNPFYVVTRREGKIQVFNSSTDFDVLSLSSTPASLTARLRGRSIFLEVTLKITLSQENSYWRMTLKSLSGEALDATVGFPAFARLIVDQPRTDAIRVPWGSGATLRDPARLKWTGVYGSELSSLYAVWSGGSEGVYLADNNRCDLSSVSESEIRRAIQVGPESGLPEDSGPSLALAQTIRLKPNDDLNLGPVIVGTYQGGWMKATTTLARSHGVMFASPISRLNQTAMIAKNSGSLEGLTSDAIQKGWRIFLLSDFSSPLLGDYDTIPDGMGGSVGLRKSVAAIHSAGGKVLLVLDGSRVSKESIVGRASGSMWAIRGADGNPMEENGYWLMCPSDQDWRDWLTNRAARLMRSFSADGIALAGLADAPNRPCHSRNHRHDSPYSWMWGVRQLFADLRVRLDRDFPGGLLLSIGALDMIRSSADGYVAETHAKTGGRFDAPVLKAVFSAIRVYESASGADAAETEKRMAWNLANGLPVYAPDAKKLADIVPPKRPLASLAETMDASYYFNLPVAVSDSVTGAVFAGRTLSLGLSNLSDENFVGDVQLPFRCSGLVDPSSGLKIDSKEPGLFSIALPPHQAYVWRIEP